MAHTQPPGPECCEGPEHEPHHKGHDRAGRDVACYPAPGYQEAVGEAEVVCHGDDDGEICARYSQVTLKLLCCPVTGPGLDYLMCLVMLRVATLQSSKKQEDINGKSKNNCIIDSENT